MQAGWKMTQLKGKSYEEIQVVYYRAFRRNKDFIPMDSQEENTRYLRSTKKQKTTEESSKDQSKEDKELTEEIICGNFQNQIINYDDETSLVSYKTTPESYWTLDQVTNFKNKISIYLGEEDYDN